MTYLIMFSIETSRPLPYPNPNPNPNPDCVRVNARPPLCPVRPSVDSLSRVLNLSPNLWASSHMGSKQLQDVLTTVFRDNPG